MTVCFHAVFSRINGDCEYDERALINQAYRFVVSLYARSLSIFLCFKSSSLFPCVFIMGVRLFENRCLGKVSQAYRSWCVRSVYSSLLVLCM